MEKALIDLKCKDVGSSFQKEESEELATKIQG